MFFLSYWYIAHISTVPPPTISVSRDPDASVTLRHGDNLTLICTIKLDPAVDSDVVVTGNLGGMSNVMIASVGMYSIILEIPSLRATPSDTYTCTATVDPGSGLTYVSHGGQSSSLNIAVGKDLVIPIVYCNLLKMSPPLKISPHPSLTNKKVDIITSWASFAR